VSEGTGSPGVGEGRQPLPPGDMSRKFGAPDPQSRFQPFPSDGYRQPQLQAPVPVQQTGPRDTDAPPPKVRLDRIVMLEESHNVEGQVVQEDRKPQAGAQVVFVSQDQLGAKQTVTADSRGEFKVSLASGSWLVYVQDETGRQVLKEKVEVKENQPRRVILTSNSR
jgi:hypothetical protein